MTALSSTATAAAPERRHSITEPGRAIVIAALACGLVVRLICGWQAPLWLDETYTAVIATQPDLASLLRWCLTELSGPVYYVPIWCWQQIFGPSDLALRLPSVAASILTPMVILRWGHEDRDVRMLWAALAAIWVPGFTFAWEARPYALVLLLCSGQAIAFLRMMRTPVSRTALFWVGLSSAAILTHYHALLITGLQGMAFLACHRGRALRCWPALLAFAPMLAWMSVHLPFVLHFTAQNVTAYNRLAPGAVFWLPMILMGTDVPAFALLTCILLTLAWQIGRRVFRGARLPYSAPDTLLALSGVCAIAIVFGMGFFHPNFAPRYVLPFMPATLFGIAIWARSLNARGYASLCLLGAFGAVALSIGIARAEKPALDYRWAFNFEQPTDYLRAAGAKRLLFLWDNPVARLNSDRHLAEVGGFFFARAGDSVPVTVARLAPDADPNFVLLQMAPQRPGSAILWAYHREVPGTRGARYPARIDAIDPRWRCRNFGVKPTAVVACIFEGSATPRR